MPLQDTAPTPSFGGFGLKQVFSKTESESGYHEAWAGILPPRGKVLEVDPGPWITSVLDVKRFAGRQPLEADFCVDALREALGKGKPEVFNADQGEPVHQRGVHPGSSGPWVKIGMDENGRYEVYLKAYANVGVGTRRREFPGTAGPCPASRTGRPEAPLGR